MTSLVAGLFCRAFVSNVKSTPSQPRQPDRVEVTQDGSYIVVAGAPDAGSLSVQLQPGAAMCDDQVLVTWSCSGESQAKSFALYKWVGCGSDRRAVKNVEYLEVSGGYGRQRFWNQTRLSTYFAS